ncbi:hypothetical protein [Candidatus Accumulibacter sp. ACC005]|uniref:hypothetical protein n=1 Tax=Candidatus Accumulibacter sp. ACC005 TaxID=2823331 RepID=UPI0025B849E7|nr:hypothetical protein [Candidatus Accumulibacter sp. ACC005]
MASRPAIGYTSAKTIDVQITSPRSIKYLAIIREFDAMMTHLDALWLSCVITDSQYARGVYEWKRRILRLAGQIRQIATRAVLAARRKETASETVPESGRYAAGEGRRLDDRRCYCCR